MPETFILPDLDIMDATALKAVVRAQHAHSKIRHQQYIATLSSRASEIAHLKLLLDKLQRMLFGARSEKLVRQVAQLELQLEELETSRSEEEVSAHLPSRRRRRKWPEMALVSATRAFSDTALLTERSASARHLARVNR
jgi:hypothetical protein